VKRRVIFFGYLAVILTGFIYLLLKVDSPLRYTALLPIFISIFFIPNGKINLIQFLKFVGLSGLIFYIYSTLILILIDTNIPVSKSWIYALLLTVWAAIVRLTNTTRPRKST